MKIRVAPLVALCAFTSLFASDAVEPERRALSPDGKFIATWNGAIWIRENRENSHPQSFPTVKSFLKAGWVTPRLLLAVEAVSGGSYSSLFHLDGQTWRRVTVEPELGNLENYGVVDHHLRGRQLNVVFAAEKREGLNFTYFKIVIPVNVDSMEVGRPVKTLLSEAGYFALLNKRSWRKLPDRP